MTKEVQTVNYKANCPIKMIYIGNYLLFDGIGIPAVVFINPAAPNRATAGLNCSSRKACE